MKKWKFKRMIVLSLCLIVLSSSVVLADGGASQPSTGDGKIEDRGSEGSSEILLVAPDTPVSSSDPEPTSISDEILEKQREIDKYLFEDYADEIEKQGFMVTHTGPFEDYVEIGITPYSEEHANFLYEIFGRDMVKIVESHQAEILDITTSSSDGIEADVVSTTAAEESAQTSSSNSPLVYSIAALILLGGGIMVSRKIKAVK